MAEAYAVLMQGATIALGIALFVCLFRAVRGPSVADRIVAINMTGTITIALIIFLALMLQEGYLIDIAIIYAMLSFLSVVLLCRIYIGSYRAKTEKGGKEDA